MLDHDLVLDDAARERLLDRFGPGARQWCEELPERVGACCLRWGLELREGLSGQTSRVYLGRQDGARAVVLKLTPDRSIAEAEAIALRGWARTAHAADLLAADLPAGALLLERIEPGTKVSEYAALPPLEAFARLLRGLREPCADGTDGTAGLRSTAEAGLRSSAEAGLGSSAERVEFLFGLIARRAADPHVSEFVPGSAVDRARDLARDLATGSADRGLVHGDLHLANILDGGTGRGLVAIDPRPSCGDRAQDAVDIALTRATSAGELDDRIHRLAAIVPGLDAVRLRGWCEATAVLIVVQWLYGRRREKTLPDGHRAFLLRLAGNL